MNDRQRAQAAILAAPAGVYEAGEYESNWRLVPERGE